MEGQEKRTEGVGADKQGAGACVDMPCHVGRVHMPRCTGMRGGLGAILDLNSDQVREAAQLKGAIHHHMHAQLQQDQRQDSCRLTLRIHCRWASPSVYVRGPEVDLPREWSNRMAF